MIIAEVTFTPIGKGESVGDYVIEALRTFRKLGIKFTPNSMGTVIEADSIDKIFEAVKEAEDSIIKMGVKRLDTIIKIDHRIDKENSSEIKLKRISEFTYK
ncbi:MAG: MTH1187 family thiamine-binding protein [Thermoplasmata archaeon]